MRLTRRLPGTSYPVLTRKSKPPSLPGTYIQFPLGAISRLPGQGAYTEAWACGVLLCDFPARLNVTAFSERRNVLHPTQPYGNQAPSKLCFRVSGKTMGVRVKKKLSKCIRVSFIWPAIGPIGSIFNFWWCGSHIIETRHPKLTKNCQLMTLVL